MVYPRSLIIELLQDMDKALWYFSLELANGFGVLEMAERASIIFASITHSGLFE